MGDLFASTAAVRLFFSRLRNLYLGGTDAAAVMNKVAERYQFKNFPQNATREEIDKHGLKFSNGTFEFQGRRTGISDLILYNDGIVATSNTTEHSSAVLDDLMEFVIRDFQFRQPISPIKKVYVSTVTVEFRNSMTNMLAHHAALLDLVGNYLNAPQRTSHNVQLTRIDFTLDDPAAALNARPRLASLEITSYGPAVSQTVLL